MSLNCEIVLDLAGRYFDGTASAETVRAVREHLKSCPDCNRFYRHFGLLKKQRRHSPDKDEETAVNNYAALADRIRMRKLFMTLGAVIYAGIIAAVFTVLLIIEHKKKSRQQLFIPVSFIEMFKAIPHNSHFYL